MESTVAAAAVVVVEQARLGIWENRGGRDGTERRTVGHCEMMEWASELVGRDEGLDGQIRWW